MSVPFRFAASLVLAASLLPRAAFADEGEPEGETTLVRDEDEAPPARRHWYGWQALIVDGGSLVLTPELPPLGLAGYLLGGPIVHAAHGQWWTAGASLALRTGLPIVGGLAARGGAETCGDTGCLRAALGAAVGAVVAVTVDAAALSWETAPNPAGERGPTEPTRARRRTIAVSPGITPRREGGVDLGVAGVF